MTTLTPEYIRNIARRVARKMTNDDPDSNAQDFEVAGWIAHLRGLNVKEAMLDAACEWRWGIQYRTGLDFSKMPRYEEPDYSLLASLDPSIEEQVACLEIIELLKNRLKRGRGGRDKLLILLDELIRRDGDTHLSRSECERLGLSLERNVQRKRRIRRTLMEILHPQGW